MFNWLRSFFRRRSRFDVYSPREKLIYRYWDGEKMVSADPLVVFKRLMAIGPELAVDIKVSTSISKDAVKAQDSLIAKIRDVFSLKPLVAGGLGETETALLLDHFLTYCGLVKKNSSPSVISSPTSEASSSSFPDDQGTSNSLGSGSIASVCSTAPAPSSPAESPSPLV